MQNGKVVIAGRGGKSFQAGYDTGYAKGKQDMTDEQKTALMQTSGNFDHEIVNDSIIIAALKKQQPMLVVPDPDKNGKYFRCPACNGELKDVGGIWEIGFESETPDWCPDCGQHLAYPDEKEASKDE